MAAKSKKLKPSAAATALLAELELTKRVAQELTKDGFTIINVGISPFTDPCVMLSYTPRCGKLGGSALRRFSNEGGTFREWVSVFAGVKICWHEPVEGVAA